MYGCLRSLAGLFHLESYCSSICNEKVLKSFFVPHSFVTRNVAFCFFKQTVLQRAEGEAHVIS